MSDCLELDERGFLHIGDFRLPLRYLPDKGLFEFMDRDRRRSEQRGARLVYVETKQLLAIIDICEGVGGLKQAAKSDTLIEV